jgi:hypothetical protein
MDGIKIRGIVLAALLIAGPAAAGPLTFDEIPTISAGPVPDGYGGLHWSNMTVANVPWILSAFGPSGYVNGLVSGSNAASNSGGTPARFSADSPFTFDSAYFTGA